MSRRGVKRSLEDCMTSGYELFEHPVFQGRPNLLDTGPRPESGGKMQRNEARREETKQTKKSQKEEASEEAAPHANDQTPLKAILAKGSSYARRGADYIRGTRPAEYTSCPHLGPKEFQGDVETRASIVSPANFNPTISGQTQPYPWCGHHLIPGEAFYTENSEGQPPFPKPENFDIVLQTPYDIDHGHNQIMLPTRPWAVPVHALLQHPNNHNDYTRDVILGLNRINSRIDILRGEGKEHEAVVANVFSDLKKTEEYLWKKLLKVSRAAVKGAADGTLYKGPWCRWQTQGGKEYVWPSLW